MTETTQDVGERVIDWLVNEPPSIRKRALRKHPDTVAVVEARAREELRNLSPMGLAQSVDSGYKSRPHLDHLDATLVRAVRRVEGTPADPENGIEAVPGESVFIRVSMPPRMGKSVMCSEFLPLWCLRRHPDWKIGLVSYSDSLASSWGRQVRRFVEDPRLGLGIDLASDAGAVKDWETVEGGGVTARSIGMGITGKGFKVLIVDDAVKDYADAHSEARREALREWWKTTARTRLEPPSLVLVIGTRWHEDDFTGWVETTGDPFETINFPAIADEDDVLGRSPGDPLISPLMDETNEQALIRWAALKAAVGPYAWAALYQQTPQPAQGAVFDISKFRYWTRNPDNVSENVVLFEPLTCQGTWVDSWDFASEAKESADYSVGQRWVRVGPDRFLIGQYRGQVGFTAALDQMKVFVRPESLGGTGALVKKRVVEKASNGRAIIESIKRIVSGVIGVDPQGSKEQRARAITPEVESGNVFLPYPGDPGNEWVHDLLGELRAFPSGKHDDQVDALSQGLGVIAGEVSVPRVGPMVVSAENPWGAI